MKKIRLLLIEDNRLLRDGIIALMKNYDDIKAAAATGTQENILEKMRTFRPAVILLDLGLRSKNSLLLVKATKENLPATKIIVMDLLPTQADVLEFVRNGVSGFILKDATVDDFLKTIRAVAQGTKVLPPLLTNSLFSQIVEHALNGSSLPSQKILESVRLTKREKQVIELVSKGMTNKEIAQKLFLSTYTVKSHIHNILEKLALHTRVQIALYARTAENFQNIANSVTLLDE